MSTDLSALTERDMIRNVAARWRKQYFDGRSQTWRPSLGDSSVTYDRLRALDPETATAEQVNSIIGNRSWSKPCCDICGDWVDRVAVFHNIDAGINVCVACLDRAQAVVTGAK